jgi:hypothetical protein
VKQPAAVKESANVKQSTTVKHSATFKVLQIISRLIITCYMLSTHHHNWFETSSVAMLACTSSTGSIWPKGAHGVRV